MYLTSLNRGLMANLQFTELFEVLSDTDLMAVVGGSASGLVTGAGTEVGNIGKAGGTTVEAVGTSADNTYGLVREEGTGSDGALDVYDFLLRG